MAASTAQARPKPSSPRALRAWREDKKLSRRQLAERSSVPEPPTPKTIQDVLSS